MKRIWHQAIYEALLHFDAQFLAAHQILFGRGTRISLELAEYRESVDIDFLCPDKASFRAVRAAVTSDSLGHLVTQEFVYPRQIRADRDAVRCMISMNNINIKLEFVSCADYDLKPDQNIFPVPCINRHSCFFTKLLANADRSTVQGYFRLAGDV
jgi:hypothetical protein